MPRLKPLILITFICLCLASAYPMRSRALEGSWEYLTPLGEITGLAVRGSAVWCATTGGILTLDADSGEWTVIRKSEGLPDYGVTSLHIDRGGALWAGVEDGGGRGIGPPLASGFGVCRYEDGVWTVSRREQSLISHITESPDGAVWCASGSGLLRFDETQWRTFTPENSGLADTGIGGVSAGPDGAVWVAYSDFTKGISRFDGGTWTTFAPGDSTVRATFASTLSVDRDGVAWVGTDIGAVAFDGASWKEYSFGRFVTSIAVGDDNIKWFRVNGGVWRYAEGELTFYTAENSGLPGNSLRACAASGNTVHFAVEAGDGIVISSFDGSSWKNWTPDSRYFSPRVCTGIFFDRTGTPWAGGYSGGMLRYDGTRWQPVVTGLRETDQVRKITEDRNGVLWTVGRYGAASFDGSRWTGYPLGDTRDILTGRNGDIWFVGDHYCLYRFDGAETTVFDPGNTPLQSRIIADLVEDSDGVLWVATADSAGGTGAGLCSYDGAGWKAYTPSESPVRAIAVDRDNTLWALTRSGRLLSYGGKGWSEHRPEENPPVADRYYDMAVDNENRKWITAGGRWLGCFDGSGWKTYGDLPIITASLFVDSSDRVWLFSPIPKEMAVLDGETWTVFTRENSPLGPFPVIGVSEGPDRSIWFSSTFSITRFIPDAMSTVGERETLPAAFALLGNHPNPFNPSTTISFTLPEPGTAELTIYDITGRKVRELVSERRSAGTHSVVWDGRDSLERAVSSGVYLSRMTANGRTATRKMLLVR